MATKPQTQFFVNAMAARNFFGKHYQTIPAKFREEMLTKAINRKLERGEVVFTTSTPFQLGYRFELVANEGRYQPVQLTMEETATQKADLVRNRLSVLGPAANAYL